MSSLDMVRVFRLDRAESDQPVELEFEERREAARREVPEATEAEVDAFEALDFARFSVWDLLSHVQAQINGLADMFGGGSGDDRPMVPCCELHAVRAELSAFAAIPDDWSERHTFQRLREARSLLFRALTSLEDLRHLGEPGGCR